MSHGLKLIDAVFQALTWHRSDVTESLFGDYPMEYRDKLRSRRPEVYWTELDDGNRARLVRWAIDHCME